MILKINQENLDRVVSQVARLINDGGVVVLPFDTVYGFACDPDNEAALQKIYELKNRPENKTIGLATYNIETIEFITEINQFSKNYIANKTPGRYTFILKAKSDIPISELCIKNGTIGIRIPDSKLILEISKKFGEIIAQTSANISGQPNCYSIDEIKTQYGQKSLDLVDLIVDGGEINNLGPSILMDLTGIAPQEIKRQIERN